MNKILLSSLIDPLVVTNNSQLSEIEKSLYSFNFSHGQNFEKLRHSKSGTIYSLRLNLKSRAIFTPIQIDNQLYWVLLKLLPNHEYHRLQTFPLRQLLENDKAYLQSQTQSSEVNFENIVEECIVNHELNYFKNQYLVFDEKQSEAVVKALPILISGAPGSGKTCVATEILSQKYDEKVLYVSHSNALVQEIHRQFQMSPLFDAEHSQAQFLSYQELMMPFYEHQNIADKQHFVEWCKGRHINDSDIYYQEFRIFSGYFQNVETYLNLGIRQSYFSDKRPILHLFNDYLAYLDNKKLVDLSLSPLSKPMTILPFDMIVIDEAQELSGLQLNILKSLAPHNQVAILMDTNQSSQDNISKMYYVKNTFEINSENCVQLKTCYRSSQAVVKVANKLLEIKNACIGGVSEKGQLPQIEMQSSISIGEGLWCHDKTETIDLLRSRFEKDARCIVIAHESNHEEARKFGLSTILTPEQALGLEYHYVIAYKLFAQREHDEINRFLKTYSDGKLNQNRSKNKIQFSFDTTLLNLDLIAVTRAKEGIFIVESNQNHPNQYLIKKVKEALIDLGQTNAHDLMEKKHESNAEEWQKLSEQLQNRGLKTIADTISAQYIQTSKVNGPELLIDVSSPVKDKMKKKKKSKNSSPALPEVKLTPIDEFIQSLIKQINTRSKLKEEENLFTNAKTTKISLFSNLSYEDLTKKFELIIDGVSYIRSLFYYLALSSALITKRKPFQKYIESIIKQLTIDDMIFDYQTICPQNGSYDQHIDLIHIMLRYGHHELLDKIISKHPQFKAHLTKSYLLTDIWRFDEQQACKKLFYFVFCGQANEILKKILKDNKTLLDFEMLTTTLFYIKNPDKKIIEYGIIKGKNPSITHNVNMFSILIKSKFSYDLLERFFHEKPELLHQMTAEILLGGNNVELTNNRSNLLFELAQIPTPIPWLKIMYEHSESLQQQLQIQDLFYNSGLKDSEEENDSSTLITINNISNPFEKLIKKEDFDFLKLVICSRLKADSQNAIYLYQKLTENFSQSILPEERRYLDLLCSTEKGREFLFSLCQYPIFCQQFTEQLLHGRSSINDCNHSSLFNYLKRTPSGQNIIEAIGLHNPIVQSIQANSFFNHNMKDNGIDTNRIDQIVLKYKRSVHHAQIILGGREGDDYLNQSFQTFQRDIYALIKTGLTKEEIVNLLKQAFYLQSKVFLFVVSVCNDFDAFSELLDAMESEVQSMEDPLFNKKQRELEFFNKNQHGDVRELPYFSTYCHYNDIRLEMLELSPTPDGNIMRQVIAKNNQVKKKSNNDSLSIFGQNPNINSLNGLINHFNNFLDTHASDKIAKHLKIPL